MAESLGRASPVTAAGGNKERDGLRVRALLTRSGACNKVPGMLIMERDIW